MEIIPILLIVLICAALLIGYPVAFTLAGTSILFALLGIALDFFDPNLFKTLPMRIFGIMNNQTLLAVPLFVFHGRGFRKIRHCSQDVKRYGDSL